ncbi:MAG: PfkB family carbohydrate kinase [Planctomycetota bacterium]
MITRDQIARAAAERLSVVSDDELRRLRAVVGFDGFIDSIIRPVARRRSMAADDFEPIGTITEFAQRCAHAAGKSTNIELHTVERRFGGNGPLMAGAMGRLGLGVTYIGAVGQAGRPSELDALYEPLRERCERVVPIAPAAGTDALEFEDGKIMLGKPASVQSVTWERVKQAIGLDELTRLVDRAAIVAVVNWVMMAGVEGIWQGLFEEVGPRLSSNPRRGAFVDLCDPAKRTDEDLSRALGLLGRLDTVLPVTLGLNESEADRIAAVCGLEEKAAASPPVSLAERSEARATGIREALGIACCVVHPREGAAAATESESAWFAGPFTPKPKLSTGAGDHFNGGFAAGRALGLPLAESLAVACATSGVYVREAASPTRDALVRFLRDLPPPTDS